jgi:hypothetical protein
MENPSPSEVKKQEMEAKEGPKTERKPVEERFLRPNPIILDKDNTKSTSDAQLQPKPSISLKKKSSTNISTQPTKQIKTIVIGRGGKIEIAPSAVKAPEKDENIAPNPPSQKTGPRLSFKTISTSEIRKRPNVKNVLDYKF